MSEGSKKEREDEEPPASGGGSERRRQERIAAAVVTELLVEGVPHMAMLHDFSSTGALLLTRTRVVVDERIELRIHLGESLEQTLQTTGSIVRVEPWADGASFWPLSIAVKFDEAATGHEARLRAIAAKQIELGLLPSKG
jgi:hypothetical protein